MNWPVVRRSVCLGFLTAVLTTPVGLGKDASDLQNDLQGAKAEKELRTPCHPRELEERMKEFQQQMEEWAKGFEKEFQSQEKQEWLRRFEKSTQEFQKQLEERA